MSTDRAGPTTRAARLRSTTTADEPVLVRILVEAFVDDPFFRAIWPEADDYRRAAPAWFAADVRQLREHGVFRLAVDEAGLTCWVGDGDVAGPGEFEELQAIVDRTAGGRGSRAMAALEAAEAAVPAQPHWTCVYVAVRPAEQGRGVGRALLGAGLVDADRAGRPVHLVAMNPRTLRFYERSGFRVLTEVRPEPAVPPLWSLWRDPQP